MFTSALAKNASNCMGYNSSTQKIYEHVELSHWFTNCIFFQDTSNRIEISNNKIEAIKNRVDNLKQAAEDLKANATNIRELDVTGIIHNIKMAWLHYFVRASYCHNR